MKQPADSFVSRFFILSGFCADHDRNGNDPIKYEFSKLFVLVFQHLTG